MRASSIKYRNVMSNPSQARSSAHHLSALSTRSSSSPKPVPFMSSRQPFRPPKPNARKEAANTPMPMKQNSNCHCPVSHSCRERPRRKGCGTVASAPTTQPSTSNPTTQQRTVFLSPVPAAPSKEYPSPPA